MKDEYAYEARFYDRIWGKYDYDTDVKFLGKLLKKFGCRKVLDVGCGTGNHAIRLSRLGYDVMGVDVSPAMLKVARSKIKNKRVQFQQGDMKKLGNVVPKNGFDAAIMLGHVAYHLNSAENAGSFLRELHKVLKKKGLFVFNARNAKQINEQYLNTLRLGHLVNENELQVAVLEYNTREPNDPHTIIWRPLILVKEGNNVDFQIREHKLHWFEFSKLSKFLTVNGFKIVSTYSGPSEETFDEDTHADMWFVTLAK